MTQIDQGTSHEARRQDDSSLSALLRALSSLIPEPDGGDAVLEAPLHACAALVLAAFLGAGYEITSLNGKEVPQGRQQLPADWQARTDAMSARLAHPSHGRVDIACAVLSGRLLVAGAGPHDQEVRRLDVRLAEVCNDGVFPVTARCDAASETSLLARHYGFFSLETCSRLAQGVETQVVSALPSSSGSAPDHATAAAGPRPSGNPTSSPWRPSSGSEPMSAGRNPLSIGQSDLDPLGGRAPAVPPPFGGAGPAFGIPQPQGGDGMFAGPGHPIFSGSRPMRPQHPDAFLPPGAVPPGARFDPIVPGQPAPRGGLPFGGPFGRRSGDPDWDEAPPPGPSSSSYDDMFM